MKMNKIVVGLFLILFSILGFTACEKAPQREVMNPASESNENKGYGFGQNIKDTEGAKKTESEMRSGKVIDFDNKSETEEASKTEEVSKTESEKKSGEKNNSPEGLKDNKLGLNKDRNFLEIGEKVFLQQINDIYFSFEDYKDMTIAVEGMFSVFENSDGSETKPVVFRYGPGCCGNDGWGGFLLKYEGAYPEENDWIRVTGKPILEESEYGFLTLYLEVETLEIKEDRGAEFVTH